MAQVFSSNAGLHSYLERLRRLLADGGSAELAEAVGRAIGCAGGISTEFLGESRIALRAVSQAKSSPLDESERQFLWRALSELDAALDRR